MKKNYTSRQNNFFVYIWLFFHIGILIAFFVSLFFTHGINISASLFSMVPSSVYPKNIQLADEFLTENSANNFFIFASNADFKKAKEAAFSVYENLNGKKEFSFLELSSSSFDQKEALDFVHKNRFNLLPSSCIEQLSSDDGIKTFGEAALSKMYGMFSLEPLENIDSDPFMTEDFILNEYASVLLKQGSLLSVKDGVNSCFLDEKWYVAIRGAMSKEGAALASKKNGVSVIYKECLPLEKEGTAFVFSGTPFHSYKSSKDASRDISIIGAVSMVAVVLILLAVFKSPVPILFSVAAILVSCATAFFASHLFFGKVHLLSLVFGTTLIGSCIDYSLHFFILWKADASLQSGFQIRDRLFKGLFLSLLSTEICYLLLIFAPFEFLKQISVFSFTGILSSFLTSVCIYPLVKIPVKRNLLQLPHVNLSKSKKLLTLILLFFSLLAVLLFNSKKIKISNDISSLYKMRGKLKEDTILSARITGSLSPSWFIVSGFSEEDVLQKEEKLLQESTACLDGAVSTSLFVPSKKRQEESKNAFKKLLRFVAVQLVNEGFDDEEAQAFAEDLAKEFTLKENEYLSVKDVPEILKSLTNNLWLGKLGEEYFSVVMPCKVLSVSECKKVAEEIDGVTFVNKAKDISASLDDLTLFVFKSFVLAFIIIILILKFFYSTRQIIKIAAVPVIGVFAIAAFFVVFKMSLEFFCLTGTMLVFGLGLDYIIYMMESSNKKLESENASLEKFAVFLSFLTTAVSFGSLAFSSFVPSHVIGLAILVGLCAAFFTTALES